MVSQTPKIEFLLYETYMARILDSVGTEMFRKTWCLVDGVKTDVTEGGEISCPVYVSSVLMLFSEFGLIKKVHARVEPTTQDMIDNGWYEIKSLVPGAIILWEKKETRTGWHLHNGFYIGSGKAISHRDITHAPMIHDADYASEGSRKIEKIFWHDKLGRPEERKES